MSDDNAKVKFLADIEFHGDMINETGYDKSESDLLLAQKQNLLIPGVSIKNINGESLLGSGNIIIDGVK